jgi:hypothetical protein
VVLKTQGLIVSLHQANAVPGRLNHGARAARTPHPAALGTCG